MNWDERTVRFWLDNFTRIPPRLLATLNVPTDLFPRAIQVAWGRRHGASGMAVCPVVFESTLGGWLVPPVCHEIYLKFVFDKEWASFSIEPVALLAVEAFEAELQAWIEDQKGTT